MASKQTEGMESKKNILTENMEQKRNNWLVVSRSVQCATEIILRWAFNAAEFLVARCALFSLACQIGLAGLPFDWSLGALRALCGYPKFATMWRLLYTTLVYAYSIFLLPRAIYTLINGLQHVKIKCAFYALFVYFLSGRFFLLSVEGFYLMF